MYRGNIVKTCSYLAAVTTLLALVNVSWSWLVLHLRATERQTARSLAAVSAPPKTSPGDLAFLPQKNISSSSSFAAPRPSSASLLFAGGRSASRSSTPCHVDVDCCATASAGLSTGATGCSSFCRLGSEIADATSVSGWKVRGSCAPKWSGFCYEDEDCSAGELCSREHVPSEFITSSVASNRFGTCREDVRCQRDTCMGRGSCRNGRCTCAFGFTGPRCERSTDAVAFLIYGNQSANFVMARVLVRSLRVSGESSHDIVAIVPEGSRKDTPASMLRILEEDGVRVRYTQDVPMPAAMASDPIIRSRWAGVMNKFAVWQLTEYTRVAIVDLDIVLDVRTDPITELFRECTAPLCAVRDGDPRFLNAGVMVVQPSEQRLVHIVGALKEEHHFYEMPEQSFLTRYAEKKENGLELKYLDKKWNSCVGGGTLMNRGWAFSGYNMLHSCSWGAKPANVRMCFPDRCDQTLERHTVLVWQQHHAAVDSCVLHRKQASCDAAAQCGWCGHYCSDKKMPCSHKLLKVEHDTPASSEDAAKIKSGREACTQPEKDAQASWDHAPSGWWAWPKAAMYQVLIDRFATSRPRPCEDLKGHCGGDFVGMQEKLAYLEQLGVDGVVMSPVVENMPGGYHGYWPTDLNAINAHFGSEQDLKELVLSMHQRLMKVVVDVNLNHAGGPGVEVEELIPKLKPFNKPEHYHSPNCSLFSPEDFRQSKHVMERCQLFGLPDYNHENPAVFQGLQRWLRRHVDTFGFDGMRIDAAHHMPKRFLKTLPTTGPPVPAFHEVISSDMKGIGAYANNDLDAVYNYPLYFVLRGVFADFKGEERRPITDLVDKLNRDDLEDRLTLNFLDNNDMPRFARMATDQAKYRNALMYILGTEGVPVLLYGSEQNLEGNVTSSDPVREEPPDHWRPAMWDAGYATSGSTFRMIQRALWLRKHFYGFHQYKQQTLHADHEVLVFSRGPVFFALTSVGDTATPNDVHVKGEAKHHAQRILWHNESLSCASVRRCNLLAEDVRASCRIVTPGMPDYFTMEGAEPVLDVPEDIAELWIAEHASSVAKVKRASASSPARALRGNVSAGSDRFDYTALNVFTQTRWRQMPGVQVDRIQNAERIPRAFLPVGVKVQDPVAWQPAHAFENDVSSASDTYAPPVGVPVDHVEHLSVKDACYFRQANHAFDKRAFEPIVYTKTAGMINVFCSQDDVASCGSSKDAAAAALKSTGLRISKPVLHLSHGRKTVGGYHDALIHLLPRLASHLDALREGNLLLFIERDFDVLLPLLKRLGVASSVLIFPDQGSSKAPVRHFCSSEIRVIRHQSYASPQPAAAELQAIRYALMHREAHVPASLSGKEEIVFMPGSADSAAAAWQASNDAAVASALEAASGLPVRILSGPSAREPSEVAKAMRRAKVVVGMHGADLANMVYAPAGTKVLELVPQLQANSESHHYRTLAGALSFEYLPVRQEVRNEPIAASPVEVSRQGTHLGGSAEVNIPVLTEGLLELLGESLM